MTTECHLEEYKRKKSLNPAEKKPSRFQQETEMLNRSRNLS